MLKFFKCTNFGNISLCFVFVMALSNTKINDGKIVIAQISPIKTPFAITIPMSFPNANLILHNAKNPAIVVIELPTTDTIVFPIAMLIASSLFLVCSFSCK